MPWAAYPVENDRTDELEPIGRMLDPVLTPLEFAPAQAGASGDRGQVIFCRGLVDSTDGGCIDLVLDVEAAPEWRIVRVRYDGFDDIDLDFDAGAGLADQLAGLVRTLPEHLPHGDTG